MYLFTETILSSCPHEDYCRLMTILSLIALFFQTIVAFTLINDWKKTKSEYTKFLTVVRTIHIFYTLLGSTIGEFRFFLPRKTAICHGVIRFFGDYSCGISLNLLLTFISVESFSVVYAFNGQYNIICRKVKFHENNLFQLASFGLFIIIIIGIFICLNFALISRNEAIDLWYISDGELNLYLKKEYALLAFGGQKQYLLFIVLFFIALNFINFFVHYVVILKMMVEFINKLREHNKTTSIKNDYTTQLNHHIINSLLPAIFLFLPLLHVFIIVVFFYDEQYFWYTKPTTNTIAFIILIYAIVSALYIIFFKYKSLEKQKNIFTKKVKLNKKVTTKGQSN
uniref:G-protein coupled receptors family 1 profile domain-containing protein n=1 Tax=Strongyloides venezuelensis TaxID=75913 RepID=A0A0K0EX82_STRVS